MSEWKKKDCITIQGAAKRIGVKRIIVQAWIDEGRIESQNGLIQLNTVELIRNDLERFISLESYLKQHDSELFDSRYVCNREKYMDYLEKNDFFGLKVIYSDAFPYPYESGATLYFETKDLKQLDAQSISFFKFYGLSESEKCQIIIDECKDETTRMLITSFLENVEKYTPIVTAFVSKAINIDVRHIDERDVTETLKEFELVGSKDLMIEFVEYVNSQLSLKLGKIERKVNHTEKDIGAYSYRIYVAIAKAIFCEESLSENHIIEKCFDKSIDFEAWLFLSIHFVCGWRSKDICENWPYLCDERVNELKIDIETLKDNILTGKMEISIYYEIGTYIEKSIELSATRAHKTGKASDLLAPIGDELKVFFGRMALISYCHYISCKEGRLIYSRRGEYLNHIRFRQLFGDSVYKLIGRHNLSSRKLNKSYLQSMEERARKNGAGTMAAYTIASYARNHSNIDTTAIYIYDHGLNGETAEVVLTMMFDRGVLGTIRYKEFLAAFPDAFDRLTAQEQTKLLAECEISAYELEIMSSDMKAELDLKEKFAEGDTKQSLVILNEMFEIAQGFGKAKEPGIYCKKRAVGDACENPKFESCIANVCPYLVFTDVGIKSLVSVVNSYAEKARITKNPKYKNILRKVILPAYKDILSEISNRMTPNEKDAMKIAIGKYNEEYVKGN